MTKDQFINLLRSPATINLNMVKDLEEITEQFPYFQNAHLLLAKQYHGHENIRYESYLRKAAAYAPDRSILYKLIMMEPLEVIHINENDTAVNNITEMVIDTTPVIQNEHIRLPHEEIAEDIAASLSPSIEIHSEVNDFQELPDENLDLPMENDTEIFTDIIPTELASVENDEEKKSADPLEIINRRIAELQNEKLISTNEDKSELIELSNHNPVEEIKNDVQEQQETKVEITAKPETENTVIAEQFNNEIPELLNTETEKFEEQPKEEINEPVKELYVAPINIETREIRAQVNDEEKKEVINLEITEEKITTASNQHSFLEWLKIKNSHVFPDAVNPEISDFITPLKIETNPINIVKPPSPLIDKFIKEEPRIVPLKSEFYSAGNMARQSLIEHDDMISETLARIYASQGNHRKAIDAYKRLSLKFPEKSGYFATLIQNLEEKDL